MAVRFSSSFGADLDAIDAFKRKEQYEGWVGKGKKRTLKFAVEGNDLKLHGHTIATHTDNGIEVSNAGFDTGLTYSALKELGINAKRLPNGRVQLHTTEVDGTSGDKVIVPYNEVSDTPIRATKKQVKPKNPNRTVTEQSKFRQEVEGEQEKGELPLSTTSIQPDDQKYINSVTGINTKIPRKQRATDAHHIFGVATNPKLKNNPNNGIMLTRKEHREVETLNKGLLRKKLGQLKLAVFMSRIAKIKLGKSFYPSASFLSKDGSFREVLSHADDIKGQYSDDELDRGINLEKHFKRTGEIRVQNATAVKSTSVETHGNMSSAQKQTLRVMEEDFPEHKFEYSHNEDSPISPSLSHHLRVKPNAVKISKLRQLIATFKSDIRNKNDMAANVSNLSADSIMNKFIEFKKNNDDFKTLTGTFDPLEGAIIDARVPAGAMRLQNIFGAKGKLAFNSITDTRQGPVTDLDLIRSQLKEIEQSGEVPSIGVFEGSLEATIALIDKTDDEILEDLLESQRSTAIIDPDTRLRIVDNVAFRQN